jgi:hypothetical protein
LCFVSHKHKSNVALTLSIYNIMEDESNEIPTSVKRKCNQSEIALKWWSEKRAKIEQQDLLMDKKDVLVREVDGLL